MQPRFSRPQAHLYDFGRCKPEILEANEYGQVGDGGSTNSNTPQDIDLGHGSKDQVPCEEGDIPTTA